MPKLVATVFAVAVAALVAGCSSEPGPYLKISGGGFIFNYRLANAMLGVLVVAPRSLPEGATVEVSLTNPAGGEPLVQSAVVENDRSQFDFRFESLSGIRRDVDYLATVRLLDPSGKEIERIERIYHSDIDQAETMPDKPLTVGPGYARNPEATQ